MLLGVFQGRAIAQGPPAVSFDAGAGRVVIRVGDRVFATYVYDDPAIQRPYFCDVCVPDGDQVTRNHPPVEGTDRTDHADYHPGLWLAFGDINGADFWRNRAVVQHERFVEAPSGGPGEGGFAVENVYRSGDTIICREVCRYRLVVRPRGYFLLHESEFFSEDDDFVFGDQEEMGLGVRMATPLIAKEGGAITNSDGLRDEKGAWGKQATWCDYGGVRNGRRVGVTLMPHPDNFRPAWFHARDYGLLVANPFGRNAFTGGEKSAIVVKKGDRFPLRFCVFVYATDSWDAAFLEAAYREYLEGLQP